MNHYKKIEHIQNHESYWQGDICISLVHEALTCAKDQGFDLTAILAQAGISLEQTRVSVDDYAQLWVVLANHMNDEFFGMDRRPLRRGSYQFLSQSLYQSDNLAIALKQALRFFNLMLDDVHSELRINDAHAAIVIHDRAGCKPMFTYATYWMLLHGLMCWLTGQRILIERLSSQCSQPIAHHDYQVRFCDDIFYQQDEHALYFSKHALELKIRHTPASWYQFLQATPHNLLVRFKDPCSLRHQIRQHLLTLPMSQWPDIRHIAQQMNISEATLQRRFKQEGMSYQQLKNQLRCDQAIRLLSHTSLSLQSISEQLNFHDPSAFHRAFKKWMGLNPGAYRLQYGVVEN